MRSRLVQKDLWDVIKTHPYVSRERHALPETHKDGIRAIKAGDIMTVEVENSIRSIEIRCVTWYSTRWGGIHWLWRRVAKRLGRTCEEVGTHIQIDVSGQRREIHLAATLSRCMNWIRNMSLSERGQNSRPIRIHTLDNTVLCQWYCTYLHSNYGTCVLTTIWRRHGHSYRWRWWLSHVRLSGYGAYERKERWYH